MIRRHFLAAMLIVGAASAAQAGGFVAYEPGLIDSELSQGKTVFVDYSASWCLTCKAQERVIGRLMQENPDYATAMTFVRVDWDEWSKDPVTTGRDIPRRSTLIVLQGDRELGRIVAGTDEADIRALMDLGL